ALWIVARLPRGHRRRQWRHDRQGRRRGVEQDTAALRCFLRPARHEAADAVERVGGDAAAVTQPAGEFAIVDGAAAESRFGKTALPAKFADFLQYLFVHGPPSGFSSLPEANQLLLYSSIRQRALGKMGQGDGNNPTLKNIRKPW